MEGRICVVTGASSGIGREAARGLAGMGAEVVLVCRSAAKAEETRRDIAATTGRDRLHVVLCDLASQAEVRRASAELLERFPRVHVLVNNAGLMSTERVESVDGLEMTLAVNHLAPLLMTSLLRERLVESARDGGARVITVSSDMHWFGGVDFDDLQAQRRYRQFAVYANSKLMNVLFTRELARRLDGTGVAVNCMHPGLVATSFGPQQGIFKALLPLTRPFSRNAAQGADTIVWLASSEAAGRLHGEYCANRKVTLSSPRSKDLGLAKRLWEESERLVGLAG